MSVPWSSKGSKGTPIAADELLIIDSADANPSTQNKRITIGTLPVIEVPTWTQDHDAGGFDLLNVGGITINNPADSFQYIVTPAAIVGDRILNLPLMTGTDTILLEAFIQSITNKIFPGVSPNQFEDDGLVIQNPADTFNYLFQSDAIAAGRTISLPLLLSNDTMVTEAFIQTLTNKTLDDFSNEVHADTVHIQVRNESGGPLGAGDVVYISGFSVPEDLPLIELADASNSATMPAVGILTSAILDNANGDVTISGELTGPSTTGFTVNEPLYVSETAGEYTETKPTGTALIQNIGTTLKVGGVGVGVIKVASVSRTNDLPNIPSAQFWLGNASDVPTAVSMSVDATMDNAGALTVANNAITDAKTDTFTTTKISTLNKALLNTAIVYNDQTNTFGDFAQIFPDDQLFIENPAATFEYQIIAAAIAADRILTLPLLTGNDTLVTEAHTQTLTNKTIDGDDNTIVDINETQMDVSVGVAGTILTSNGVGSPPTYQANDGGQTPWTGNVDAATFSLLNLGGLELNNPADTFQYIITPAAIVADRILNLPLMTGTDTLVLNDFAATLTNKTITAAANTLTIASTDLTDTGVIVRTDQTNTFGDFAQIFADDQLFIENPAATFEYQIIGAAIAADRTITLPLLAGNDTLVTAAFIQTLTNKTVDLASNTLTGTTAEFNTALSDGDFATLAGTESITNKTFDNTNEFEDDGLIIQNVANTFNYIIQSAAIVADRTITLPLLTGPDTLVTEAHIQTLTNKTMDGDLNTFVDINETQQNVSVGTPGFVLTSNGPGSPPTYQVTGAASQTPWGSNIDGAGFDLLGVGGITMNNPADTFGYIITPAAIVADRILNLPLMTGTDTILLEAFAATLTNKIFPGISPNEFEDDGLVIQNVANTFNYTIQSAAIAADRILNLPLMTGTDTILLEAFAATLTNKTVDLASNTLTGTTAQFNTALSDGDFATRAGIEALTNKTFDNSNEFEDDGLLIQNPTNTFNVIFQSAAIAADRILNIPLMTGTDTMVLNDFAATLTNKTITAAANTLTIASTDLTDTAVVVRTDQINTFGDFAQTFLDDILFIQNPAATFEYQIIAAAIVADRTLTLPLLTANDTFVTAGFANAWGTVDQNITATGKWQEGGVDISPIGLHDISIDAGGIIPVDAEPITTRIMGTTVDQKAISYVPFLTAVTTFAVVKFKLPRTYNNGTITAILNWTSETEGSGDVIWGVSGVAVGDGDDLAGAGTDYGTEITVTDTQSTINFSQDSPRTAAITLANTPVDGDMIYLKIQRLGADGGDTFGQEAQLLNVYIDLTTDAAVSS